MIYRIYSQLFTNIRFYKKFELPELLCFEIIFNLKGSDFNNKIMKARFFIYCAKFSTNCNFLDIKKKRKIWYCWKATAKWNINLENILEKKEKLKNWRKKDTNFQLKWMLFTKCDHKTLNPSWSLDYKLFCICFIFLFFWKTEWFIFIFTYHHISYIWIVEKNQGYWHFFCKSNGE